MSRYAKQPGSAPHFLCYHSCVKTSRAWLRDTTFIGKYALLLLGPAPIVVARADRNVVVVGGWLRLRLSESGAVLCKLLRAELDRAFRLHFGRRPEPGKSLDSAEDLAEVIDGESDMDTMEGGAIGDMPQKPLDCRSSELALSAVYRLLCLDKRTSYSK